MQIVGFTVSDASLLPNGFPHTRLSSPSSFGAPPNVVVEWQLTELFDKQGKPA